MGETRGDCDKEVRMERVAAVANSGRAAGAQLERRRWMLHENGRRRCVEQRERGRSNACSSAATGSQRVSEEMQLGAECQ